MDAAVEAALNLLPSNTDSATSFSLFGLLNKAQSPMGKALLKVGAGQSGLVVAGLVVGGQLGRWVLACCSNVRGRCILHRFCVA